MKLKVKNLDKKYLSPVFVNLDLKAKQVIAEQQNLNDTFAAVDFEEPVSPDIMNRFKDDGPLSSS